MRSVIQRCNWCRVLSEGKVCGEIGKGLVALLGIKRGDTEEDALYISDKILHLRIFEDENNKMNLSLLDTKGALMIVSQFTLYEIPDMGVGQVLLRRNFQNRRVGFMNMWCGAAG